VKDGITTFIITITVEWNIWERLS